ncbi:MAG TPA: hypothetical protein PLS50_00105 [Candidatus Dojkabacteria bacterium]|nr:hypothetical protein [Candidatus Dojkabacteria bacterium]
MARFILFLSIFLTPIIIFYIFVLFVTWGEMFNPGDWSQGARVMVGMITMVWLFFAIIGAMDT